MKRIAKNCLPLIVSLMACALILLEFMLSSSKTRLVVIMIFIMILLVKIAVEILFLGDENKAYTREKKQIYKTYGFILSKIIEIPDLRNYTVYKYKTLEEIIDKAMDFRMNIYYVDDKKAVDFLLIDGINLYIYTFKQSEGEFSRIDKYFIGIQHQ